MCGDDTNLTRSVLRKMPYLHNVLKESTHHVKFTSHITILTESALRLYPSVPVNTRTAVRTTMLPTGGGPDRKSPVLIPKGSVITFSVYSMHQRPDLYGMEAEIFRPARWTEDMPLQRDPAKFKWGYLPFHGGPRSCLRSESPTSRLLVLPFEYMLLTQ